MTGFFITFAVIHPEEKTNTSNVNAIYFISI